MFEVEEVPTELPEGVRFGGYVNRVTENKPVRKETIMKTELNNMKLEAYLEQNNITTYEINGKTYYLGCGISSILGFDNTTVAMKKNEKNPRISTCNWKRVLIEAINPKMPVYLFNLDGVKELIYNSHNNTCKYIKFHIDPCCPISSNTLDDFFD